MASSLWLSVFVLVCVIGVTLECMGGGGAPGGGGAGGMGMPDMGGGGGMPGLGGGALGGMFGGNKPKKDKDKKKNKHKNKNKGENDGGAAGLLGGLLGGLKDLGKGGEGGMGNMVGIPGDISCSDPNEVVVELLKIIKDKCVVPEAPCTTAEPVEDDADKN